MEGAKQLTSVDCRIIPKKPAEKLDVSFKSCRTILKYHIETKRHNQRCAERFELRENADVLTTISQKL